MIECLFIWQALNAGTARLVYMTAKERQERRERNEKFDRRKFKNSVKIWTMKDVEEILKTMAIDPRD